MSQSRRAFLGATSVWAVAAGLVACLHAAQRQYPFGQPPFVPFEKNKPSVKPDPRQLKAKQKNLKKDAARLSHLAQQLQQELEKTNPADVLPVDAIRKAEEIEKLAKHIKDAVRG